MRLALIVSGMVFALAGTALAGSGYDRCLKEEKALKAKVASDCSGLRYLLDPNSCFRTRKNLQEYTDGKCAAIGAAEQVDLTPPPAVPEQRGSTVSAPQKAAPPAPPVAVPVISPPAVVTAAPPDPAATAAPLPGVTLGQLQEENARLKAENQRLKSEIEQLRKGAPR